MFGLHDLAREFYILSWKSCFLSSGAIETHINLNITAINNNIVASISLKFLIIKCPPLPRN